MFCEETDLESYDISLRPWILDFDVASQLVSQPNIGNAGGKEIFWKQYGLISQGYTTGQLSFGGHTYDGFVAFKQAFEEESGDSSLGTTQLSTGICIIGYVKPREQKTSLPMTPLNIKVHFPSWS